jgi:hypothetical protein
LLTLIPGQQDVVDRLNELTRSVDELIFLNLAEPLLAPDRRRLRRGNLTIKSLMAVVKSHGLRGRSLAISVSHPDADLGHYMTVQCISPEKWDHKIDSPVEGTGDTGDWKVEDFQFYLANDLVNPNFSSRSVLQIIGRRGVKDTIYGSSKESIEQFSQKSPVEGSKRIEPTLQFDDRVNK